MRAELSTRAETSAGSVPCTCASLMARLSITPWNRAADMQEGEAPSSARMAAVSRLCTCITIRHFWLKVLTLETCRAAEQRFVT